jgi:hypothetical protein
MTGSTPGCVCVWGVCVLLVVYVVCFMSVCVLSVSVYVRENGCNMSKDDRACYKPGMLYEGINALQPQRPKMRPTQTPQLQRTCRPCARVGKAHETEAGSTCVRAGRAQVRNRAL